MLTEMAKRRFDRNRARELARLFHRLSARMRLEELAGAAYKVSTDTRELERLKHDYLPMWSTWCALHRVTQGVPGQVPFTDYMKGSMREFDQTSDEQRIDGDTCRLIDQAVDELTAAGHVHARAVLAVRYLNERVATVFRSQRLVDFDPEQADELCDHVERELLPIVKRLGLLL